MDDFILAISRYRRRRFDQTIDLCNKMLDSHPNDQAAWLLKCQCLVKKNYLDDIEMDEEGAGDILLDENATTSVARPGTSIMRPGTSAQNSGGINPLVRPMSKSGRPLSGFVRPGTNNRPATGANVRVETALQGNRPGTTRPMTSGGRYIRLGTASLEKAGGQFIMVDKLNLKNIAKKNSISRALCDYLLYVEHNPKKALELAAEATVLANFDDWWWKERLGKCYYQLGLYREAEKQLKSSLKNEDIVRTNLQLAKVFIKLDQPNTAIEILNAALQKYPYEINYTLGLARVYDMLNDSAKAVDFYKRVLSVESSNLEAVASIASYHFYTDQPEIALRFYKRLVQLGVHSAEIWNNLALCCFYDAQYDLFYTCFEKALEYADDSNIADIWYNMSQVAIAVGDLNSAYQALKVSVAKDSHHAESLNNLGVLEVKKGNPDNARYNFQIALKEADYLFEPAYNMALWAYKQNDYQEALKMVNKALEIYPDHFESKELKRTINANLSIF